MCRAQLAAADRIDAGGDRRAARRRRQADPRFVVDLDRKIDIAAFTLADPYRVVVDLPQVAFKLPPQAGEHGRGLVKAFRYGLVMRGGSRIVLDTKGPVRVDKAFVLDAAEASRRGWCSISPPPTARASCTISRCQRGPRTPRPGAATSRAKAERTDPRPLIVIDPGHGGIDNGTKAPSGEDEKNIVLAFALTLRDKLERSGKYRVAMTRSDDTFIPLGERVQLCPRARRLAVHLDPCRLHSAPRRPGRRRQRLYAVRARLRRGGGAAGRKRKQIRRHRRRRS